MTKLAVILLTVGLIAIGPSCFATTDSQNSNVKSQLGEDPIFMQYEGINGDVNAKGHEKWIEISSFQWGVGRTFSSPTGGSSDREGSTPSVSEIVVTKTTDSSSIKLLNEALQGHSKSVKIDFCKTIECQPSAYLQIQLTNTLISDFKISSGGDRPTESLSLNFGKIAIEYVPTGDTLQWDLATNKGSLSGPITTGNGQPGS